ncbi:hypothetical protein L1887_20943 [Cichorium endivia]|nr:hypothetical protein L1887_20943 [Cichorium endivia]
MEVTSKKTWSIVAGGQGFGAPTIRAAVVVPETFEPEDDGEGGAGAGVLCAEACSSREKEKERKLLRRVHLLPPEKVRCLGRWWQRTPNKYSSALQKMKRKKRKYCTSHGTVDLQPTVEVIEEKTWKFTLSEKQSSMKNVRDQLDVAMKVTYILNKDFDSMSRRGLVKKRPRKAESKTRQEEEIKD